MPERSISTRDEIDAWHKESRNWGRWRDNGNTDAMPTVRGGVPTGITETLGLRNWWVGVSVDVSRLSRLSLLRILMKSAAEGLPVFPCEGVVLAEKFEDGDDHLASPIFVVLTISSDDVQESFECRLVGA